MEAEGPGLFLQVETGKERGNGAGVGRERGREVVVEPDKEGKGRE